MELEGEYKLKIHLDSDSVGHGYVELVRPGYNGPDSEFFGKYPTDDEGLIDVNLWDKGVITDDRERYEAALNSDEINLVSTEIQLSESEYHSAMQYIGDQMNNPGDYVAIGKNCADFVQDVYSAAKGDEVSDFTTLFENDQLENLSWLEDYLDSFYTSPTNTSEIEPASDPGETSNPTEENPTEDDDYEPDPYEGMEPAETNEGGVVVEEPDQQKVGVVPEESDPWKKAKEAEEEYEESDKTENYQSEEKSDDAWEQAKEAEKSYETDSLPEEQKESTEEPSSFENSRLENDYTDQSSMDQNNDSDYGTTTNDTSSNDSYF
jgi:hypothetical protein